MKPALIVGLCLVAAGATGETVDVQPLRSATHLRITVFWKGLPQADSKVVFYPVPSDSGPAQVVSYRTNHKGYISTQLPEGHYHVVASNAKDAARVDVELDVTHAVSSKSQLSMTLRQIEPSQSQLDAADRMPIEQQINRFTGTIYDAGRRVVPDALIEVLQKGPHNKPVAYLMSDEDGRFDATIETGDYIAIFFNPGFRMKAVPFELKPDGAKEMTVAMEVGQH